MGKYFAQLAVFAVPMAAAADHAAGALLHRRPPLAQRAGAVGIVGSRKPTEYGLNAAADIGGELAKNGAIIVSGLADGLDSAGHRAAVKENCPTIGVLGVPIDRTYPASNRELRKKIEQKGCVISEYPPESGPVGPNGFLQRNRLIAALSSALVVVEAQERAAEVYHADETHFLVNGSTVGILSAILGTTEKRRFHTCGKKLP